MRSQRCEKRVVLQPRRLEEWYAGRHRVRFHRAVCRFLTASSRAIGLGDDTDDPVARAEQRFERGDGEVRRAEKHDPKPAGVYHLPERVSLRIFRTMMSRFSPRKRSTNSVPSRWSISC